jgi:hypothetical protein
MTALSLPSAAGTSVGPAGTTENEADPVDVLLRTWDGTSPTGVVDQALVHKRDRINVVLSRVAPVPSLDHSFVAQVHVDQSNRFFFDHPLDHAPGLLLIEAARQFGVLVAHEHYGVPMDYSFVLRSFHIQFDRYAELDAPIFIVGRTADRKEGRGGLSRMTFAGEFVQRGRRIGTMTGAWRMVSPAVLARLRTR